MGGGREMLDTGFDGVLGETLDIYVCVYTDELWDLGSVKFAY